MKRAIVLLGAVLGVAALASAGYVYTTNRNPTTRFRTARVERGPIVATVSTTGTLNAVTTVQVGSQVSGQIKELFVDFNSTVRQGQLIARLDPEILQAKVNAAQADLENAQAAILNQRANVERARAEVDNVRANVVTSEANVERVRAEVENARAAIATAQANVVRDTATLANARRELNRRVDLLARQLIAQSEKDQAQTSYDTAQAQLEAARSQERAGQAALRSTHAQLAAVQSQVTAAQTQVASARAALQVAEAQLKSAEATVRQKQAALAQARVDLEHTEIRAPVNGVVVSRTVDVGQTVAASLQAPTLFTIAQDLTRMQVEAAVDEADIGRLREGMPASFTVDAFPGQTFQGEIIQIRKAPQVVQNVVTYTVVIAVANPDRVLMPGMTANVRVEVDRRADALRVPNAALRFRPASESGTEAGRAPVTPAPSGSRSSGAAPGRSGGGGVPPASLQETLTRELTLTPEQQTRVNTILEAAGQAMAALRGQGLDEGGREAERRRIRSESQEKIRQVLTTEQRAKYETLVVAQARRGEGAPRGTPARVFALGPDGKPEAIPIVIGLSDGSASEVIQGELQPGQELLIGQSPSSATSRPSTGPRMRF